MPTATPELTPDHPLMILAFDQRGWLSNALWDMDPAAPVTGERATVMEEVKSLVGDGMLAASAPAQGTVGMLVDSEFGTPALDAAAPRDDVALCIPLERNNRPVLELEPDCWETLDKYQPAYAKLLIWHNPDSDPNPLQRQLRELQDVSAELQTRGQAWILEILQPPTDAQLSSVNGDRERYDDEVRPDLMVETISQIHDVDVYPDVWKLEGLSSVPATERVVDAMRQDSPGPVHAVVLGRNAPDEAVDDWLTTAARGGFAGFAIGRSIWWEPAKRWLDGDDGRATAVAGIAARYERFTDVYLTAR